MNKESYEKLQTRLHKHHILHEDNLCTAAPIYLVQAKKVDWGYEEEYAELHQLYNSCDESGYDSVEEFVDDYDEEEWRYLFKNTYCLSKKDFLECHTNLYDAYQTLEQIDPHGGWSYLHGNPRWETHNIFLTMDDANKYIDGKYIRGENCRVYVDSLCRSYEFRGLLESIAKGELVWREDL
tara:strand:+ start:17369 stop:17911 length:543 start_codon:yes stop_codon:yes gene_type:complete